MGGAERALRGSAGLFIRTMGGVGNTSTHGVVLSSRQCVGLMSIATTSNDRDAAGMASMPLPVPMSAPDPVPALPSSLSSSAMSSLARDGLAGEQDRAVASGGPVLDIDEARLAGQVRQLTG